MDKRTSLLILGFILFVISVVGFILNLVGVSLLIFKPIDSLGFLWGTVIKLILLTSGVVLVYFIKVAKK